jgi:hypothetical protein
MNDPPRNWIVAGARAATLFGSKWKEGHHVALTFNDLLIEAIGESRRQRKTEASNGPCHVRRLGESVGRNMSER